MKSTHLLIGLLAGIAAGAIAGILFAPQKGSETRKKVFKKGENYAGAVKEKFNEYLAGMSKKYDNIKEDVSELNDKVTLKKEVKTASN
jgi:gas vesicle protein